MESIPFGHFILLFHLTHLSIWQPEASTYMVSGQSVGFLKEVSRLGWHAHVCVHASRKIRGKGVWGHGHPSTLNFWILCANRWCSQVTDFIQPQHWHTAFLRTSVQSIDATRGSRGMLPQEFSNLSGWSWGITISIEALQSVLNREYLWPMTLFEWWSSFGFGQHLRWP